MSEPIMSEMAVVLADEEEAGAWATAADARLRAVPWRTFDSSDDLSASMENDCLANALAIGLAGGGGGGGGGGISS